MLGGLSGGLSVFLDFCFNEGNIFDFYYQFIIDYIKPKSEKLFKLLGGCNICFNIYPSTIIFEIYNYYLNISYIYYLPYIITSILINMYLNGFFNIDENVVEQKNLKNTFKIKKTKLKIKRK